MVPRGPADLRGARGALTPGPEDGEDGRFYVIFNPASGRGRGARRIEGYLELLRDRLPAFDHGITTAPGEERALADRAVEQGYRTVVAVGGDGTWSHVADRLMASGKPVRFGVLPSGTGNDFGRSLGLAYAGMADAVDVLAAGHVRRVDVGRIRTPSHPDGAPGRVSAPRHFLNLVGFGFDIAVIDAAAGARFLKGELLYKVTALRQLFGFPGFTVEVESGDAADEGDAGAGGRNAGRGRCLMLTVSNGRFFGGGFPIAPGATVEDGALHACFIGDASPLARARLFNLAERGRHVESDRVRLTASAAFRVTCDEPPRFEADGDVYQATEPTVEVEVMPGALEVLAPPPE